MTLQTVVEVNNAYKIFGSRPERAVERLKAGTTREELAKHGTTAAVIDASFEVQRGEIFVVMGLSGSGKSTLIRMLNGLLPTTSGSVKIHGTEIASASPPELRKIRREHISMVFQHFALFPHRTVLDNVAFGLRAKGIPQEERYEKAREAINTTGLAGWEDSLPSELSGGMQQRVGLARALATETDILLMDEAFSALDPLIRREMQDQLIELQARLGRTIVFITHDLNEAMRLGDRIAMMRDGKIVQIGTADEILTDPANDYVTQFVADVDRSRVLNSASVMEPPADVVGVGTGPLATHLRLREQQLPGMFVVSRDRHFLGVVHAENVANAVNEGATTLKDIVEEVESVTPDTPLVDVLNKFTDLGMPVPVVENDRLRGVIPAVTLFNVLGSDTTPSAEPQEPNLSSAANNPPPSSVGAAPEEAITSEGQDSK